MLLSRWKLMAGVLGVSIGGLAATASQCPKWDRSSARGPDAPVAKVDTKVAPAGPATPSLPAPTPDLPAVPAAPVLMPAGATQPPLPVPMADGTKPPPASGAPVLPEIAPTPPKPLLPPELPSSGPKPTEVAPASGLPPIPHKQPEPKPNDQLAFPPIDVPVNPGGRAHTPPSAPLPDLIPPTSTATPAKPTAPTPIVGVGGVQPTGPAPIPAPMGGTPVPPPAGASGSAPGMPPVVSGGVPPSAEIPQMKVDAAPSPAQPAPVQPVPATEGKFRILLRVGDGEPMFEVKNGDSLVLKVSCEKVDIKSPEKGVGLSEVTARGKVRFAGFGAEGTCDELKFFAGNGEVNMTGEVKVVVRDKLGRVESELTSTTLKYKIDASSVGGQIKP